MREIYAGLHGASVGSPACVRRLQLGWAVLTDSPSRGLVGALMLYWDKALLNVSEFLALIDYSISRELKLLLSDSN